MSSVIILNLRFESSVILWGSKTENIYVKKTNAFESIIIFLCSKKNKK